MKQRGTRRVPHEETHEMDLNHEIPETRRHQDQSEQDAPMGETADWAIFACIHTTKVYFKLLPHYITRNAL